MTQKIVCIVNNKGGVGKTTTAVNLAAGLVRKGKKVLLMDMDSQANLTAGLKVPYDSAPDVFDTLLKRYTQAVKLNDLLYIIPGNRRTGILELDKSKETPTEGLVKRFIKEVASRADYEYIIFDCPPSLGHITTAVMVAANLLIIPMRPDYYSMHGLSRIINMSSTVREEYNPLLKLAGILITGYDGRKVSHREISDTISSMGYNVFNTRIRDNVALAEAPAAGTDIFNYSPKSSGAIDYNMFCDEFETFVSTM